MPKKTKKSQSKSKRVSKKRISSTDKENNTGNKIKFKGPNPSSIGNPIDHPSSSSSTNSYNSSIRSKRRRSESPSSTHQPTKIPKRPTNATNLLERIESVEDRMLALGIPLSFGSTQGKHVPGANPKGSHLEKEIEFRTWLKGSKKKTTGEVRR